MARIAEAPRPAPFFQFLIRPGIHYPGSRLNDGRGAGMARLVVVISLLLAASPLAADDGGRGLQTSASAYTLKIRELTERVEQLKQKIFDSKVRLQLLQEVVLTGSLSDADLRIVHRDAVGGVFRLCAATYFLDGARIFHRSGDDLQAQDGLAVFSQQVTPGPHRLSVLLQYRGHGFGLFPYLEGYGLTVKSGRFVDVPMGRRADVEVVVFLTDDLTRDPTERVDVRYEIRQRKISPVDEAVLGSRAR